MILSSLMGLSRNNSKIYMRSNGEELGSKFYRSAPLGFLI